MNRIKWIDIVKGICIILVVISHITGIPFFDKYLFAPYVTTFYFLSGAVAKFNNLSRKDRILRRVQKLLYAYLKYSIIISVNIYIIYFIENRLSMKTIFYNIIGLLYSRHSIVPNGMALLNNINSTFWFITSLITSYGFFELLIYLEKKWKTALLIGMSVVVSIIFEYLPLLLPWSIDTAPFGGALMFIGYKVNKKNRIEKELLLKKKNLLIILALIGFYMILCEINSGSNFSIRNYGRLPSAINCVTFFIISIIGIFLYILLAKYIETKKYISKVLIYIGKNSIHILCLHLLIIYLYDAMISTLDIKVSGIYYWINVAVCTFLAVIIPLFYGKIEKICEEKIHE